VQIRGAHGLALNKVVRHSSKAGHLHIIKDRIEAGDLRLKYLPTAEMIADILTKPLQGEQFRTLRDKLLSVQNIVAV